MRMIYMLGSKINAYSTTKSVNKLFTFTYTADKQNGGGYGLKDCCPTTVAVEANLDERQGLFVEVQV